MYNFISTGTDSRKITGLNSFLCVNYQFKININIGFESDFYSNNNT